MSLNQDNFPISTQKDYPRSGVAEVTVVVTNDSAHNINQLKIGYKVFEDGKRVLNSSETIHDFSIGEKHQFDIRLSQHQSLVFTDLWANGQKIGIAAGGQTIDAGIVGCYITTAAANGNPFAPMVCTHRGWRDDFMVNFPSGRAFIKGYDIWGPKGAIVLNNYPFLKPFARLPLNISALLIKGARKVIDKSPKLKKFLTTYHP